MMGSKNLKAIAVTADREGPTYTTPTASRSWPGSRTACSAQVRSSSTTRHGVRRRIRRTSRTSWPYTRSVIFDGAGKQKDGERLYGEEYRKLRTGDFGCYNCSARCGKAHTVACGPV